MRYRYSNKVKAQRQERSRFAPFCSVLDVVSGTEELRDAAE